MIFDNDDTLYYAPGIGKEAVGYMVEFAASALNISVEDAALERVKIKRKYGVDSTPFAFNQKYGIDFDEMINFAYSQIELKKYGISKNDSLIKTLSALKVPKFILTNNTAEFASLILSELGVANLFKRIFGCREVDFKLKPAPEAYLRVLNFANVNASEAVMVDDRVDFLLGAAQLRMRTILFSRDMSFHPLCGVDFVIRDLKELPKLLSELK